MGSYKCWWTKHTFKPELEADLDFLRNFFVVVFFCPVRKGLEVKNDQIWKIKLKTGTVMCHFCKINIEKNGIVQEPKWKYRYWHFFDWHLLLHPIYEWVDKENQLLNVSYSYFMARRVEPVDQSLRHQRLVRYITTYLLVLLVKL